MIFINSAKLKFSNKFNPFYFWVFSGAFCYALFVMVVLREQIIPIYLPSIDGHILADPYYYHEIAMVKAREIQQSGFSAFEFHPSGQGVSGIASYAYLIWGNPYAVVCANALLHAGSVVVMLLILREWFSLRVSLVALIPLIISPYMMLWYSQINKDSFVLFGNLVFLYGFLRLIFFDDKRLRENGCVALLLMLAGIVFIWFVRPYVNKILLPIVSLFFLIGLFRISQGDGFSIRSRILFFACAAVIVSFLSLFGQGAASDKTLSNLSSYKGSAIDIGARPESKTVSAACLTNVDVAAWQDAWFLPSYVNGNVRALVGQRCLVFSLLETQYNLVALKSVVDFDVQPTGTVEAISYIPRAFHLALFYPGLQNLDFVFEHKSVFYTVAILENLLICFGMVCLFVWVFQTKEWTVFVLVGVCILVMTIYAYATPFLGALYRYRYPWQIILACLGFATFLDLVKNISKKNTSLEIGNNA